MFKFRHATLIILSGLLWFAVGVFLLSLGLGLLVTATESPEALGAGAFPLLGALSGRIGSVDSAALLMICTGLGIGYLKCRYVLSKSVTRIVNRICSQPQPRSLNGVYGWGYAALIGGMMLLGMAIKIFGVPSDIRGLVDTAVGAALLNGSMLYFRYATVARKEELSHL